jgi:hypothetical protein
VRLRISSFLLLLTLAGSARAQNETKLGADFRKEGESLKADCSSFKSILSCAEVLFTDHPVHIAAGSIAPQNGFGAGVALVTHYTPNDSWRLSWNADAVGSMNGSWRAGVYMKAIFTRSKKEVTTTGRPTHPPSSALPDLERPVFDLYAQAISLNKIDYFGLGPSTPVDGRSFYGMREIIPGINVKWPVFQPLHVSLYGEMNGRFVSIRPSLGQASPSIEQLYTEATAPGLTSQPAFVQFGEGIRIQPTFFADYLRLNYFLVFQQYLAPGDSTFSFRRFTVDLSHQIPLYKKTKTLLPKYHNGPDDCSKDVNDHQCPAITRNLEGSFGIRLFISESMAPAGHVVPFYFQPTLGGSDIMGNPSLGSYQDYRFRAPNVLLLRGSFEHSIYGPLGLAFNVDEGKVAMTRGDIGFTHLAHSFSGGLTLRAGGFPQVFLLYAWGGNEGSHTTANINTSLLGGSARPSLF